MTTLPQRRITLIRHAKAEDDGAAQDHLRHLAPRGVEDAKALGARLQAAGALPEVMICSTALRTRETLAQLGANIPTLLTERAYLASAGDLLRLIQEADDAVMHLGILAHNPGLHMLAAMLVDDYANPADEDRLLLKFPTSACVRFSLTAAKWADVQPASGLLEMLDYGG